MVMFDPNVQIEQKCDFKTRYHVIQQAKSVFIKYISKCNKRVKKKLVEDLILYLILFQVIY